MAKPCRPAGRQVETLATRRYERGAVSYLDVVNAQTTALRTRQQAIEVETRRLQASVRLFRAVGGGWSLRTPGGRCECWRCPQRCPQRGHPGKG
jgi:outer membrane protein TolC